MNPIKSETGNRMLTTAKSACVLVSSSYTLHKFQTEACLVYESMTNGEVTFSFFIIRECQAASTLGRQFGSFIFIAASYHYPCNLYPDPFNALIIVLKLLAVFELLESFKGQLKSC
ncbi:hypothetical protein CHUAL_011207 [Chamberlinius hualienensis]